MKTAPKSPPTYANYLPDEILIDILEYVDRSPTSQSTLAHFCRVSRQWYNVGVSRLYESPNLVGKSYDLFVRTVCPSLNAHVKKSDLAGLVKVLDLSVIVHQGSKATTARLLNRTRASLERFAAPQASFGVNCWAALTKCTQLRVLDLSLVSEAISYSSLTHTVYRLQNLRKLYLPRCSSNYDGGLEADYKQTSNWPAQLTHLQISGKMHVGLMRDMLQPTGTLPPISSLGFSYCPGIRHSAIRSVVSNLSGSLTTLELRDLPSLDQGSLDNVLDWANNLKNLTIAIDYIGIGFVSHAFAGVTPDAWEHSKPLERLRLVSSGQRSYDPEIEFSALDLVNLIECHFLGRLRYIEIDEATGWVASDEGELDELENALNDLDMENWDNRQWHYAQFEGLYQDVTWEDFIATPRGQKMRPQMRLSKEAWT